MTNAQYIRAVEVAKRNGLEGDTMPRFVNFLVEWSDLRGKDWTKDDGYNDEWAIRFKKEREYGDASSDAVVALVHVDGEKKALEIATKELAKFMGIGKAEARVNALSKIKRAFEYTNTPVPKTFRGRSVARSKPKAKCICQSAGIMIGELPDFETNLKKITK